MGNLANGWNITEAEWARLVARTKENADILEDGSFVRAVDGAAGVELRFFASALNKPDGWRYAFTENVAGIKPTLASIGRAWHHSASGFVEFEVEANAAAQALIADYEGGAGDFDDATIEQEVERALKGTPADRAWLMGEFARLTRLAG